MSLALYRRKMVYQMIMKENFSSTTTIGEELGISGDQVRRIIKSLPDEAFEKFEMLRKQSRA